MDESRAVQRWCLIMVVAASALACAMLWRSYAPNWRHLWTDVIHDRNAHLELGLGLASDLSHGRISGIAKAIDRARTWPPLHDAIMVAASLLCSGGDPKYGVMPSLIAFGLCPIFALLAARRMTPDAGCIAGIVAAAFALVAPAFRSYATDVMLEGPGACLTAAVLWLWLAAVQENTQANWRRFAIMLAALFFLKYNYWLLVVMAIVASTAFTPIAVRWWIDGATRLRPLIGPWLQRQARHPLTYAMIALCGVMVWVGRTGGGEFEIYGRSIPVRANVNIATALWWVLMLRVLPWWWREGRNMAKPLWLREVIAWHVMPVAAWFLWPQKLAIFVWFLNPGANAGEFPIDDRWSGYAYYFAALSHEYHAGGWAFAVSLILAAFAVVGLVARRMRNGSAAIVLLVIIAFVLTANHPNRKNRFLHSWIPALWISAGAGAGLLAAIRPPMSRRVAVVGMAGLVAAQIPSLFAPPFSQEGGVRLDRPSALDITDELLNQLSSDNRPAILSNMPIKFFTRWTFQQRFGNAIRPETEIPGFDSARTCDGNAEAFARWLEHTSAYTIVFVDFSTTSPWHALVPGTQGLNQLAVLLQQQKAFPTNLRQGEESELGVRTVILRR